MQVQLHQIGVGSGETPETLFEKVIDRVDEFFHVTPGQSLRREACVRTADY